MTYKELGKYEIIDQIDAAKYFADLEYIDTAYEKSQTQVQIHHLKEALAYRQLDKKI